MRHSPSFGEQLRTSENKQSSFPFHLVTCKRSKSNTALGIARMSPIKLASNSSFDAGCGTWLSYRRAHRPTNEMAANPSSAKSVGKTACPRNLSRTVFCDGVNCLLLSALRGRAGEHSKIGGLMTCFTRWCVLTQPSGGHNRRHEHQQRVDLGFGTVATAPLPTVLPDWLC